MSLLGAGALAYSSMVGLCQGIKRHQLAVWGKPWPDIAYKMLRVYGWLAPLLSLWLCSQYWGWAQGSVAEFGMLSVAGLVLVFGLPYWPKTLAILGAAAALVGLGIFACYLF